MKLTLFLIFGIASLYPVYNLPKNDTTPEIPDWGPENKQELEDLLAERKESYETLIDNVAFRGEPLQNYRLSLRDMNSLMKTNYAEMIEHIGRNLYPVIVVSDYETGYAGVGSTYTLYLEDGTIKRMIPVSLEYEMCKNLAHMALGLFTIVSSYFKSGKATGFHEKLRSYQCVVKTSLYSAKEVTYNASCLPLQDQIEMLSMVDTYISESIERSIVDYESYKNFTSKFTPYAIKALHCASDLQVSAALPALTQWKTELGPEKWRKMYVLIPVIWPVARRNPRQQIFETLMDKDRIKTHILKIENAKDVDEMRTTMGRIVGDRTLADLVFGTDNLNRTVLNLALSTRRDLVSSAADDSINKYWKP